MKRAIGMMVGTRLLPVVAAFAMMSLLLTSCYEPDKLHSISGQVSSGGSGLSGVILTLSGAGSAAVTTDASGNYTFSRLTNASYTITPAKTGFIFSPTSSTQTLNGADITAVNFTATSFPTFSMSGTVTSGGSGLSGVTMMVSGAGSATATTDASGNYTFSGLANGSYTITPNKTGFTFSPASSAQTLNGAGITAVNFTALPVSTFSIFGMVTSGGSGLSGVTLTLSGAGSATATTDASGAYIFTGLANASYTITPSKTGFAFSPTSSSQTINGTNVTAINFTTMSAPAQIVACPSSGTTNVTIQDFFFTPATVAVSVNGIVQWTNNGPSAHTVTSGTAPNNDGIFNSSNLAAGTNVCVQFLAIGSYPYFSATDPSMTGSVTVQ